MAKVIEQVQRPTLVMAHNKTLAAQLYSEFREFFPHNAVEYFVCYYDYYQPEAYIPRTDTYIEKDADINEEIDQLRLAATAALLTRRDVIIVASVSCIYGLGSPEEYGREVVELRVGETRRRDCGAAPPGRHLLRAQRRGLQARHLSRARRHAGHLSRLPRHGHPRRVLGRHGRAHHRDRPPHRRDPGGAAGARHLSRPSTLSRQAEAMTDAIQDIEAELEERLAELRAQDKLLEAQRLEQRTLYDLEMMREIGYCSGIENYSRHLSSRKPGDPPWTLLDYFPDDFLLVIDESHMTIPQMRGMYNGDRARKEVLVEYRLPPALGPGQPAPPVRRVRGAHQPGHLHLGHARPLRAHRCRPRSWSRSSGPPAWSTPRSSSSRPRARSTTCSARSAAGSSGASGCW